MLINELPAESQLTITASSDDRKASLESAILALSENDSRFIFSVLQKTRFRACAAVVLFTSGSQTINFSAPNVQCDCIGICEDTPYLWENVKIVKFELPDAGKQHIIFSNSDARPFNRRKDFRQWLGVDCTLTYGSPPLTKRGTVKDISVTGVGLLVSPDCQIEPGARLKVQFYETKTNSKGEDETVTYTVIAVSVRVVPVNERTKLIGCRIAEAGRDYVNFLYKKQRESMQHDKGMDL